VSNYRSAKESPCGCSKNEVGVQFDPERSTSKHAKAAAAIDWLDCVARSMREAVEGLQRLAFDGILNGRVSERLALNRLIRYQLTRSPAKEAESPRR
jgi:hypothetical protein